MRCEVVTSRGPCKMPALKGESACWAHSPARAEARHEARRRGGELRRRAPLQAPVAPLEAPPIVPFALGAIEKRGDVAAALLRVAHAIADGTLDAKRGRLLTESLRSAHAAWDSTTRTDDDSVPPEGAREPSSAELRFMMAHGGRLPPGVEHYGRWRPFWVTGELWAPDVDERKAG